ncbi:unnamed protein product [Cunninghamella echinulata]
MDIELSEEELKRAFKTTPWKNNFDINDSSGKDQLNESTIGTIDLEKTLPYDSYEEDKQPSTEENITASTSPPKCIKNE